MANSTPNLGISHIATNQNAKEVTANTGFDEFDGALTALLSKSFPSDADYTLTATEGGEAFDNMAFKIAGTISVTRNIIVPAVAKLYVVANNTTGGHNIVVKTASGTGITVGNGTGYAILYCDGVNVIQLTTAGGTAGFEVTANKDVANGYAGLDANVFLKDAEKNLTIDARTTTTEAVSNTDRGKLVTFSNSGAVAASIAQAGTGGLFAAGWFAFLFNLGAGLVTLTPATSTANGAATFTFVQYTGALIYSDGTNYGVLRFGLTQGTTGSGAAVLATSPALVTPTIGGETITKAPRLTYQAFIADSSVGAVVRARLIPDQAITITRISYVLTVQGSGTGTQAIVRVTDGTTNQDETLTDSTSIFDSGALAFNVAAGVNLDIALNTLSSGGTAPAGITVTVEYRMQ